MYKSVQFLSLAAVKLVQKEGELKQTRGEVPWAKIGQLELYNGNNLQPPHLPLGSALKQV